MSWGPLMAVSVVCFNSASPLLLIWHESFPSVACFVYFFLFVQHQSSPLVSKVAVSAVFQSAHALQIKQEAITIALISKQCLVACFHVLLGCAVLS